MMLGGIRDLDESIVKTVTPQQAKYMKSVAIAKKEIELLALPDMTVFNGQTAHLKISELGENGTFSFSIATVSARIKMDSRNCQRVSEERRK